jgi:hypothetical protein
MKPFTSFLFLIFFTTFVQSQQYPVVEFDINANQFLNPIPFDVEFVMKGKISPGVQMVRVRYQITHRKNWHYFPSCEEIDSSGFIKQPREWIRRTDENTFFVVIGPFHPNTAYNLEISLYKSLDDKESQKIKTSLFAFFRQSLLESFQDNQITNEKLEIFKDNVCKKIEENKFYDKNKPMTCLDLFNDEKIHKLMVDIIQNSSEITKKNGTIKELISSIQTSINDQQKLGTLNGGLLKIIRHPDILNSEAKKIWESILNRDLKYNRLKMADTARLVMEAMAGSGMEDVCQGKKKIVGSTLAPTESLDIDSQLVFMDFFRKIAGDWFADKKDKPIFNKHIQNNYINKIIDYLITLIDTNKKIDKLKIEQEKLIEEFPDLAVSWLAKYSQLTSFTPDLAIFSNKNSYIGLDLGVAYAFLPNSVFTYAGANFYLVPINKQAPLRSFKGRDVILKRFSLLVGITLGGIERDTFKNLSSPGSLVLGLGCRINRAIKLDAGELLFRQKDANPLVSQYRLKTSPFLSFSFDIDIVGALGKLSAFF